MSGITGNSNVAVDENLSDQLPLRHITNAQLLAVLPIAPGPGGLADFGPFTNAGPAGGTYDTIRGLIIADRDFSFQINQGGTVASQPYQVIKRAILQPGGARYAVEISYEVVGTHTSYRIVNEDLVNPITILEGGVYLQSVAQIPGTRIADPATGLEANVSNAGDAGGAGLQVLAFSDALDQVRRALVDAARRIATSPIVGQLGVAANAGVTDALTQRVWANLIAGQSGVAGNAGVTTAQTLRTWANLISGQSGVQGNAGVTDALTLRVWANLIAGQSGVAANEGITTVQTLRTWANLIAGQSGVAANEGITTVQTLRTWANLIAGQSGVAADEGASDAQTLRTWANLIAGQSGVQANEGASDAQTLRTWANLIAGQSGVAANEGASDAATLRTWANLIAGQSGVAANEGASDALTLRTWANLIAGQSGVAANEGASDALTLRTWANLIAGQSGVAANEGASDALTLRTWANLIAGQSGVAADEGASDAQTLRTWANLIAGQSGVSAGSGAAAANTPRVIVATDNPTYAVSGAAAPASTEQIGGIYETVPSPITNAQLGALLIDAYKRLINPSYNSAVGADEILDTSPDAASKQPVTVRASAILTAAFVVSSEIPTGGLGFFTGIGVYTRGAVNGAPALYVELCRTVGGVDYWHPLPQIESDVLVSGSMGYLRTQGTYVTFNSSVVTAESFPMIVPLNGADKIRISSKEIGVVGTPGTLAIYGGFQNRCTLPPAQTDSKAYEIASNSKRCQEIDPLSYQSSQDINIDTTNIAATTYGPSTIGQESLGASFLSITGHLEDADGTLTGYLQVINDEDTASTDWRQIFMVDAGTNLPVNQVSVTNGTLVFALYLENARWKRWRFVVTQTGATNVVRVKGWKTAI